VLPLDELDVAPELLDEVAPLLDDEVPPPVEDAEELEVVPPAPESVVAVGLGTGASEPPQRANAMRLSPIVTGIA